MKYKLGNNESFIIEDSAGNTAFVPNLTNVVDNFTYFVLRPNLLIEEDVTTNWGNTMLYPVFLKKDYHTYQVIITGALTRTSGTWGYDVDAGPVWSQEIIVSDYNTGDGMVARTNTRAFAREICHNRSGVGSLPDLTTNRYAWFPLQSGNATSYYISITDLTTNEVVNCQWMPSTSLPSGPNRQDMSCLEEDIISFLNSI